MYTIRYFILNDAISALPYECDEEEFLATQGVIEYTRHTVHDNGVNQVCLTKLVEG